MDNPWFILILLVPLYVAIALVTAVAGAIAAPLFHRPRARFFLGFAFSLATAPLAIIAYVMLLAFLSYIPSLNQVLPDATTLESWVMATLVATLALAMVGGFYLALRKPHDRP